MQIGKKLKEKLASTSIVKNTKGKINNTRDKVNNKKEAVKSVSNDIKSLTVKGVLDDTISNILLAFKYSLNDITLMPGKQLKEPLQICAGITFLSLLCSVLKLPFLLDWKGSAIGLVILCVITYIGMKDEEKE